jgi:two-component system, NtrC family, nitrogen regulation response regulator NtrX
MDNTKPMPKLLIVDDEKGIRSAMRDILEFEEYEVDEAQNGEQGLNMIENDNYDVVLCDIKMPKMDGLEMLSKAGNLGKKTQFIMVSAYSDQETIDKANELGAFDFIPKPPDLNRQLASIKNAIQKSASMENGNRPLASNTFEKDIIGRSESIERMREIIEKVGPTEARVLITGPNGAGKEMVAKWLHLKSKRANKPLIEINCAAIPAELIESELFGHEKGSFTSAIKQRLGKFEQAEGGTLFMDEVGDMSLSAQAKVLRALQENKIARVGGDKDIKVNVRILAATNKDLPKEIEKGNFREDLYHRLNVIPIKVPSLASRKDDIPLLINTFIVELAKGYNMLPKKIQPQALSYLQELPWPGNVRELHNMAERLMIMCDHEITFEDVKAYA